jgi:hypothetical protein
MESLPPSTTFGIIVENPNGEAYDLVVMCRYIAEMHGLLKRLEPVIDDLTDFADFMKDFKDNAGDDLRILTRILDGKENAAEESEDASNLSTGSNAEESTPRGYPFDDRGPWH